MQSEMFLVPVCSRWRDWGFREVIPTTLVILLTFWISYPLFSRSLFAQTTADNTAAEKMYNDGVNYLNLGNYSAAINTWEQLQQAYPDYEKEKIWFFTANTAMKLGGDTGIEKASAYFQKIIDQKDANNNPVKNMYYEETLFQLGKIGFDAGRQWKDKNDPANAQKYFTIAKLMFNQYITDYPDSNYTSQSLYYLTHLAAAVFSNPLDAQKYAEMELQRIPETTVDPAAQDMRNDCFFYLAWAYGKLGKPETARQYFSYFLNKQDPIRGPKSLYEIAYTYYQQAQERQALAELLKYETFFPKDLTAENTEKYHILRLRATCHYQLGEYKTAEELMTQMINELDQTNKKNLQVEDFIQLVRCYHELKYFQQADVLIKRLETEYMGTVYSDGINVLRAAYYSKLGDYQGDKNNYINAINIVAPILGYSPNYVSGTVSQVTFTKRPYTSGESSLPKNNLSEEYFLKSCSLLAVCFAKLGNHTTAAQISNAMGMISQELYGRYASIREKTTAALAQLLQTVPAASPTTALPSGTVVAGLGDGANYYLLGGGTGDSQISAISAASGSVLQPSTDGNSLANAVLSAAEQAAYLEQCVNYFKADRPQSAVSQLNQLLANRTVTPQNQIIAAVLYGKYLWREEETISAIAMFELAYSLAEEQLSAEERQTEVYADATYYLGRDAEDKGDYVKAATYYTKSLATNYIGGNPYRASLMYRLGTVLIKADSSKDTEAVEKYFWRIYDKEIDSEYWTHAALQVAIYDYKMNAIDDAEETLDQIIEEIPDEAILDRVLYFRGMIACQREEWNVAAAAFEAIGLYSGESSFVRVARQRLKETKSKIQ
ncbi:MAG: tetratricopeptide repeat protein [Planctomycetaceae bacterium]|jgi:tetratricopeptide (TPR) repeat protein|nr:tetratricopeptide repeat protein [Planctomycetaceae bacterium]